jgi:hypothetical protein
MTYTNLVLLYHLKYLLISNFLFLIIRYSQINDSH